MRKFKYIILLLTGFFLQIQAQQVIETKHNRWDFVRESSISAGIGIGGNSAFGAELQTLFLPRWSVQLGAGINGFSGGFNYHIYPTVSSSYISFQAWQQGFATKYKAAYAGPMFVYRAERWLQAGLGVGYQIHKNPEIEFNSKYMMMFNLGIYLPM